MKKKFSTNKYKRSNKKRAEKSLNQKLKQKAKKKVKNKLKQKRSTNVNENKNYIGTRSEVNLPAPANFSFIDNTEEVLKYFNNIEYQFKKGRNVFVDMANVLNLSNDTIVLLLAIINNDKILKGCSIRGNSPKNPQLKKIFYESGVFSKPPEGENKNQILSRREKKADGRIAKEMIKVATEKLFGEQRRCPGIYKALLECMSNTFGHAQPKKLGRETWWLTVYNNKDDEQVSFAFIDLGVGIFKSNKMRDFGDKLASLFNIRTNTEVLKEILSGRKKSSTKIPYRGKGLPTIYKGLERNYYQNLQIISNNVKANLERNQFSTLNRSFSGTLLYWELNKNNEWIK